MLKLIEFCKIKKDISKSRLKFSSSKYDHTIYLYKIIKHTKFPKKKKKNSKKSRLLDIEVKICTTQKPINLNG